LVIGKFLNILVVTNNITIQRTTIVEECNNRTINLLGKKRRRAALHLEVVIWKMMMPCRLMTKTSTIHPSSNSSNNNNSNNHDLRKVCVYYQFVD